MVDRSQVAYRQAEEELEALQVRAFSVHLCDSQSKKCRVCPIFACSVFEKMRENGPAGHTQVRQGAAVRFFLFFCDFQ